METEIIDKGHLLVIDDEVEITKSLFRQFRRQYSVHTANNANDALSIMEANPIQVVLSDQRMPGMTGVGFFAQIKNKYPDALKLILTGYSDIEAVVGAINEGQVFRYLTKPWDPSELDTVLKEAFQKHELIYQNKRLMKEISDVNKSLENKVKERTQELEQVNVKLKDLNIEKNKYIGIVAHDLRNPIGNAFNFSKLLISGFQKYSAEKNLEFLEIIKERCAYSLNLIGDFLDSSKIESGILDLDFQEWDYCDIIKGCINQNIIFAEKKGQEIIFETEYPEMKILCDKNKMEQVINNLLSNAIKYSDHEKRIWVRLEKGDNGIFTRVIDEGKGIPENEIDAVFQVYQTTSTQSTAGEKSTGLGLAIVKKIVEAHSGKIEVASELNAGSEFTVSIPYL